MGVVARVGTENRRTVMSTQHKGGKSRLVFAIESELRTRLEAAAAEQDMSVRDYVVAVLRAAVNRKQNGRLENSREWS
jgi:hypothetical protein